MVACKRKPIAWDVTYVTCVTDVTTIRRSTDVQELIVTCHISCLVICWSSDDQRLGHEVKKLTVVKNILNFIGNTEYTRKYCLNCQYTQVKKAFSLFCFSCSPYPTQESVLSHSTHFHSANRHGVCGEEVVSWFDVTVFLLVE